MGRPFKSPQLKVDLLLFTSVEILGEIFCGHRNTGLWQIKLTPSNNLTGVNTSITTVSVHKGILEVGSPI
jgi:hypothetical protein